MNIEIKNKIIIISSPSGAGKTTLCKMLLKKIKNIILSISYTSRSKRLNEVDGKDYYFIAEDPNVYGYRRDDIIKNAQTF